MELIFHLFDFNLMPLKVNVALLQELLSNSFLREDNIAKLDHFPRFIILDCALKRKIVVRNLLCFISSFLVSIFVLPYGQT